MKKQVPGPTLDQMVEFDSETETVHWGRTKFVTFSNDDGFYFILFAQLAPGSPPANSLAEGPFDTLLDAIEAANQKASEMKSEMLVTKPVPITKESFIQVLENLILTLKQTDCETPAMMLIRTYMPNGDVLTSAQVREDVTQANMFQVVGDLFSLASHYAHLVGQEGFSTKARL